LAPLSQLEGWLKTKKNKKKIQNFTAVKWIDRVDIFNAKYNSEMTTGRKDV
jgi:hypothetical protein